MSDAIQDTTVTKKGRGRAPITLPVDEIIRRYDSGESPVNIAKDLGVGYATICKRIIKINGRLRTHKEANAIIATKRIISLPTNEMASLYLAGESVKGLADRFGVSRGVIFDRLTATGVHIRGFDESAPLQASRRTTESKRLGAHAAHDAIRGTHAPWERKCLHAQTVEKSPNIDGNVSQNEIDLRQYLRNIEIETVPQKAIGGYNCDLAAYPVAVEVFGGYWHWYGNHALRFAERTHYLLDQGWLLYIVQADKSSITPATADHVAAYMESVRRDPSVSREYRVVRSTGELILSGGLDGDKITAVVAAGSPKCIATWAHNHASR